MNIAWARAIAPPRSPPLDSWLHVHMSPPPTQLPGCPNDLRPDLVDMVRINTEARREESEIETTTIAKSRWMDACGIHNHGHWQQPTPPRAKYADVSNAGRLTSGPDRPHPDNDATIRRRKSARRLSRRKPYFDSRSGRRLVVKTSAWPMRRRTRRWPDRVLRSMHTDCLPRLSTCKGSRRVCVCVREGVCRCIRVGVQWTYGDNDWTFNLSTTWYHPL